MPLAMRELAADLLVAGGGVAGVCCALAAARLGTRVILCQDRPVLGGNASSEVRMHIVGATGLHGGAPLREEFREGGIIEELRLDLAVRNPQRSPAMMDLALYDACRRDPNLTLLLNTTVTGAEVRDGVIHAARAERQSTEESFAIRARAFVDCTGDGRLGVEAGAAFVRGREDKGRHAESLAQDEADAKTLGSSIMFQARKHEREMPFVAPPWVRRFAEGDFKLRPYARSGFDLGLEYGWWWLEWGGCLDTIRDNERIRDELLAIALGVWDHVKNRSGVDASHWALEWIGFLPGKRESRRFVGQHVLTQNDVMESRPFPDAIAYGGWPIDTHPPEGIDAPDQPPCTQHEVPFLYDIPLRACVSVGPRNLMFAGRNISATHIAFASTRVMATCAAVGQGVGTAAALALRQGVTPAGGLPAWIEVRWPRPVRLREVVLVFDTGLHRLLTLSQADGYTQQMLWGRPQPETVRDYTLEIEDAGGWRVVADVVANHQRRRVHGIPAPAASPALRITVRATNGLDHARIVEIRAHA